MRRALLGGFFDSTLSLEHWILVSFHHWLYFCGSGAIRKLLFLARNMRHQKGKKKCTIVVISILLESYIGLITIRSKCVTFHQFCA